MAEKRMFAKTIIDSDAFIDMPVSSRLLYYDLGMRADDDGFVNSPKKIMRMIGATDDDIKLLIAKKFIIPFDSGVVVIKHWRINNYLRGDRYKGTTYTKEKALLQIDDKGAYTLNGIPKIESGIPTGIPSGNPDKVSIDKNRLDKYSIDNKEIYNNNNNYIDNNNKNIATITDPEKPEIIPDDVFALYENEIGLLTPLMRKNIEESLDVFPADWVADAIKTASEANVKKWSYIAKVLGNWAADGRPDLITSNGPSKYTSGKFGKYAQTGPPEEKLILGCYSVDMCLEIMNGQRDALPLIKDTIREELIRLNISFEEKPFILVEEREYSFPPDTG